jgi:hypothetical protein
VFVVNIKAVFRDGEFFHDFIIAKSQDWAKEKPPYEKVGLCVLNYFSEAQYGHLIP